MPLRSAQRASGRPGSASFFNLPHWSAQRGAPELRRCRLVHSPQDRTMDMDLRDGLCGGYEQNKVAADGVGPTIRQLSVPDTLPLTGGHYLIRDKKSGKQRASTE